MAKSIIRALLAAALVAGLGGSARAATAHNAQAGSWGPTSNNCAPTPYYPAGGCLSSAFADDRLSAWDERPLPYRPERRLTAPTGLVPPPAD